MGRGARFRFQWCAPVGLRDCCSSKKDALMARVCSIFDGAASISSSDG
jgi:hypothetical protein|tara:strand:+ start:293 stop:436 length:144 start_codon:yes stop_codon:yes gene_type:complete